MDTQKLANKIRINALNMTSNGGSSHIGSCFSIADILSVLYTDIMNVDPSKVNDPERDYFILSKGHAGAAVYAVLAEKGYFPKEYLNYHYKNGSIMSGHVSHRGLPGVEFSTGSLGMGLSVGAGIAHGKLMKNSESRVYVLISDGECDEGATWEAALFAAHNSLNNLTAIIDYNKLQSLDSVQNTLKLEPIRDKWEAFGWNVLQCDGHNHRELKKELKKKDDSRPTVVIADTIKGKGVSFMENSVLWHYRTARDQEYHAAYLELMGNKNA